jgi:tetratricopeptide (TPR) repeat protein
MDIEKLLESAFDHHRKGDLRRAELIYREILEKSPNDVNALHLLGVLYHQLGRSDSAISYITRALEIDPYFAEAYNNLGNAVRAAGRLQEAMTYYSRALEIDPYFTEAYNNLGNVYLETNQPATARDFLQRAVELTPNFAEACNNLGKALSETGFFDEAISYCQKAIEIKPNYAEAHYNLGTLYKEKNRLEEARESFEKAIEIKPDFADAHWNLSLVLLLAGNFGEAWSEYEWRWQIKEFPSRRNNFDLPVWQGSPTEGKTLFIYTEQGVGDEIMFASCLPDIIGQAKLCIVECRKRLVRLFARSFPGATVIQPVANTNTYPPNLPKADFRVAIGSLPGFLRPDLTSFPGRRHYLIPDAHLVKIWKERIKRLGEGIKIGISWRGGRDPKVKRIRSIGLVQWASVLAVPGAHFINLQYGECSSELKELKEITGISVHDWEDADPLKDLENFAAEIAALDLVISVDNATVHMAGALGICVWVLLPFAPDWRWMLKREDSPWYPTMRLFRQYYPGDWESVLAKVRNELQRVIEGGHRAGNELKCDVRRIRQ